MVPVKPTGQVGQGDPNTEYKDGKGEGGAYVILCVGKPVVEKKKRSWPASQGRAAEDPWDVMTACLELRLF